MNGDGFGVGWYLDPRELEPSKQQTEPPPHANGVDQLVPCVFTSITPAWNNMNLKRMAQKIFSPLICAHVRAASPGLMVSEANCHPFNRGRFLWQHNGSVANFTRINRLARESLKDHVYAGIQGTTDSELTFALFMNQIDNPMQELAPEELQFKVIETIRQLEQFRDTVESPKTDEFSFLNFAMTDGRTVVATRYVDSAVMEPLTLYFSAGTAFVCEADGTYHMKHEEVRDSAVIISSEPLTENPKDWIFVPRNHLVRVDPDLTVHLVPIDTLRPAAPPLLVLGSSSGGVPSAGSHHTLQHHRTNRKRSLELSTAAAAAPFATPSTRLSAASCSSAASASDHCHAANATPAIAAEISAAESVPAGAAGKIRRVQSALPAANTVPTAPLIAVETAPQAVHRVAHILSGHRKAVLSLALSVDGRRLFSGSLDTTIKVWQLSTFKCVATLSGHERSVLALAHAPPHFLFSASSDSTVKMWDLRTNSCTATLTDPAFSRVFSIAHTADRHLFMARQDTTIKCVEVSSDGQFKQQTVLRGHTGYVYSLVLSGQKLCSASGDGNIQVWDVSKHPAELLHTLVGHEASVYSLAVRDNFLYSSSKDCTVKVWDLDTYHCVRTLSAHNDEVTSLAASSQYLYSASADLQLKIWDRERLICPQTVQYQSSGSTATAAASLHHSSSGAVAGTAAVTRILPLCATEHGVMVGCGTDIQILERGSSGIDLAGSSPGVSRERIDSLRHVSMLDALRAFVACRSVSVDPALTTECFRAAKFLYALFESIGLETRLLPVPGKNPIVWARLGSDPARQSVLFYGHYDVVPAHEPGWNAEPFSLVGRDGFLYARGVTDNKGPVLATISAVKELLEDEAQGGKLPFNVTFAIEGEEEAHSNGFEQTVLENHALFSPVDVVVITNTLWLGDRVPCLIYGLRGVLDLEMEITGPARDLHGGVEGGVVYEPLHELTAVLARIVDGQGRVLIPGFYDAVRPLSADEEKLYEGIEFDLNGYRDAIGVPQVKGEDAKRLLMRRWREPNLSITAVETSGSGMRVISKRCCARLSIRLVPNQSAGTLAQLIREFATAQHRNLNTGNRLEVRVLNSGEWWLSDPLQNVYFAAAARAIEREWGTRPLFVREGGSIPLTSFLEKNLGPVVHLPLSQSSDRPHLDNERMRADALVKAKGVLKNFLHEITLMPKVTN